MGKIAIPSGKSLQEPTERLFKEARIRIVRAHRRSYLADIEGFPGITRAIFCKPSEIPRLILDGDVDVGITGMDCVREHGSRDETAFRVFAELEYSRATGGGTRCVIFCKGDHPAKSITDMGAAPKIATEYPLETRDRLTKAGVSDAQLVECKGSAEALVMLGKYQYGVALVETGDTLRANGLKVIAEIFTSSTVLIGRSGPYESDMEESISFLGKLLRGTLKARGMTYLVMNAPIDKVEAIKKVLPSLKSPTMQTTADPEYVALATVVPDSQVVSLMFQLSREGACDFVPQQPWAVL